MAIAVEALPAAEAAEGGEAAAGGQAAQSAQAPAGRATKGGTRVRRAPAAAPRSGSSGGDWVRTARAGYSRVATPGATAQTITKLIWAVALGLIVLEIAAQATGQSWSFSLPGAGPKPQKQPYVPLYPGQPDPSTVTRAMPGVLPSSVGNTAPTAGAAPGFAP